MKIVEAEAMMTNVFGSDVEQELFENLDSQALEADELHDIEFCRLSLEDGQRGHLGVILGTQQGSMSEQEAQD